MGAAYREASLGRPRTAVRFGKREDELKAVAANKLVVARLAECAMLLMVVYFCWTFH